MENNGCISNYSAQRIKKTHHMYTYIKACIYFIYLFYLFITPVPILRPNSVVLTAYSGSVLHSGNQMRCQGANMGQPHAMKLPSLLYYDSSLSLYVIKRTLGGVIFYLFPKASFQSKSAFALIAP